MAQDPSSPSACQRISPEPRAARSSRGMERGNQLRRNHEMTVSRDDRQCTSSSRISEGPVSRANGGESSGASPNQNQKPSRGSASDVLGIGYVFNFAVTHPKKTHALALLARMSHGNVAGRTVKSSVQAKNLTNAYDADKSPDLPAQNVRARVPGSRNPSPLLPAAARSASRGAAHAPNETCATRSP